MLGGWALDLGDGGDTIYVYFIEIFCVFFICSWESMGYCGEIFQDNYVGVCLIGKSLWVVFTCLVIFFE